MTAPAGIFWTGWPVEPDGNCDIVFALLHWFEIAATVLPGPRHIGYSMHAVIGLLTNSMSYQLRDAGASQGFRWGEGTMGTVIDFVARRAERTIEQHVAAGGGTATVIILPVIRIERLVDAPIKRIKRSPAGGKRRRRARQS